MPMRVLVAAIALSPFWRRSCSFMAEGGTGEEDLREESRCSMTTLAMLAIKGSILRILMRSGNSFSPKCSASLPRSSSRKLLEARSMPVKSRERAVSRSGRMVRIFRRRREAGSLPPVWRHSSAMFKPPRSLVCSLMILR